MPVGEVRLVSDGSVAVLVIDSPEVRNALTPEMGRHLAELCDEVDRSAAFGAAVVVGANGMFCSGADRRRWNPDADQSEDRMYQETGAVYEAFARVGRLEVPTIAAVRGAAVGAGLNLALATDLRVVGEDARLLAGFLRIGLHPGGGFFTLAARTAGREAASAMGLFSEEITGDEAARIGMAWRAVPDGEVEPTALALAHGAAKDPALARAAVHSFRAELGPPAVSWEVALGFERATQMWSQRRREAP